MLIGVTTAEPTVTVATTSRAYGNSEVFQRWPHKFVTFWYKAKHVELVPEEVGFATECFTFVRSNSYVQEFNLIARFNRWICYLRINWRHIGSKGFRLKLGWRAKYSSQIFKYFNPVFEVYTRMISNLFFLSKSKWQKYIGGWWST